MPSIPIIGWRLQTRPEPWMSLEKNDISRHPTYKNNNLMQYIWLYFSPSCTNDPTYAKILYRQ